MSKGSHYSPAFHSDFPELVGHAATQVVEFFDEWTDDSFPVLCYSGFSGVSVATLLAFFLKPDIRVEQLYVRKENETSHGLQIEYSSTSLDNGLPIFVDDFVDEGMTLDYVMRQVLEKFDECPSTFKMVRNKKRNDSCYYDQMVPHVLVNSSMVEKYFGVHVYFPSYLCNNG